MASKQVFAYLDKAASPTEFFATARNYVFSKGDDTHDYKFSSAILEDYSNISPSWRNLYLAGCSQLLNGESAVDTRLFKDARELLS